METAGDIINGSLRLLGVLAEGEVPSAETSQDALRAMNQMIDSWNTERLSVFSTQDQVFTWPAGFISRTLGPSGDFVGNRPVLLDDSTYFVQPGTGVSYGIKFINQQQYNGIAVKSVTSTFPQVIFVNNTFPDIEMFVYPRPTRDLEWHFVSVEELSQPATLATTLQVFRPAICVRSAITWRAKWRLSLVKSRRRKSAALLCPRSVTLNALTTLMTLCLYHTALLLHANALTSMQGITK
jgi:hypothetical protein